MAEKKSNSCPLFRGKTGTAAPDLLLRLGVKLEYVVFREAEIPSEARVVGVEAVRIAQQELDQQNDVVRLNPAEDRVALLRRGAAAEDVVQAAQQRPAAFSLLQDPGGRHRVARSQGLFKGRVDRAVLPAAHAVGEGPGLLALRAVVEVMEQPAPDRLFFIAGLEIAAPQLKEPVHDGAEELPVLIAEVQLAQVLVSVDAEVDLIDQLDHVRQAEETNKLQIPGVGEQADGRVLGRAALDLEGVVLQHSAQQLVLPLVQGAGALQQILRASAKKRLGFVLGDDRKVLRLGLLLEGLSLQNVLEQRVSRPAEEAEAVGDRVMHDLIEQALIGRQALDALGKAPVEGLGHLLAELLRRKAEHPALRQLLPRDDPDREQLRQSIDDRERVLLRFRVPFGDQDPFVKEGALINLFHVSLCFFQKKLAILPDWGVKKTQMRKETRLAASPHGSWH